MNLDPGECRRLFAEGRIARLATIGDTGPHLVPIVFAASAGGFVTAVDHKPKSTRDLQRIRNLRRDPRVALLVDHYDEDWSKLWWVRADATGRIVTAASEEAAAIDALVRKYAPYTDRRPSGPVVRFEVTRWSGWAAGPVATDV